MEEYLKRKRVQLAVIRYKRYIEEKRWKEKKTIDLEETSLSSFVLITARPKKKYYR